MHEAQERRTLALSYLIRNLFEARSLDECLDVAIKGLSMLDFFQIQINLLEDGYFLVKRNHMDKKYQLLLEKIWGRKFPGHKIDAGSPFASHLLDSKTITTADIKGTVKVKLEDFIREYLPKEWRASKRLAIVRRVASILPKKVDVLILPLNYRGKVIGGLGISKTSLEHGDVLFLRNLCELFAHAFEKVQTREALRKSQEKLRGSEEKYRTQFEETMDAIFVADAETGILTDCNRAATELVGREKSELVGKHQRILHPPQEIEGEFSRTFKQHLKEKEGQVLEAQVITKKGEIKDVAIKGSVFELRGKKMIQGIFRDITERKRAEEALRRSEEQARYLLEFQNKVIDTADVWINLIDAEGNVTMWNRAAELISGYSREEVIGNMSWEFEWLYPDPKYRAEVFAETKRIIEKGERVENDETTITCKDGTLKTIRWYCNNILDERGKPAGLISIGIDITEIKKAQEKVRESEEKYRSIVELAPDSIMTFNMKGVITSCNTASTRLSGYSKDELVGKHFSKIGPVRARDIPKYLKMLPSTIRGKVPKPFEVIYHRKDGTLGFGEVHMSLMKERGKTTGLQAIMRDITERKRMEEELRKHTERLEELVEERTRELREAERMASIGKTAGMVGHDLRNPLQAIVNTLYLAKKTLESMPSPERQESLTKLCEGIGEQVEYMNKIVSDLQDYARPVRPEPVPTSLPQLINDALSSITVPENVKVSKVIPEGFPKLMVDPPLMRRVFTNLVTNALQAMPDGGQLTIRSSKKGEAAFISVQDTGVGIPKEDLPKLFQPLFTTKSKGQGFGLPVCERLVEAHEGSITVESEVGKGSTFTVRIPIRREVN